MVTEVGDGDGNEGVQACPYELLRTTFTLPESIKGYHIVAPRGTQVDVYYRSGNKWILFAKEQIVVGQNSATEQIRVDTNNDGNANTFTNVLGPGYLMRHSAGTNIQSTSSTSTLVSSSTRQWRFEAKDPVAIWVEEADGNEYLLPGWGTKQIAPSIGAKMAFKSENSVWYGQGKSLNIMPVGLNNIAMKCDLNFQLPKLQASGLIEKLENCTHGVKTGDAAFKGLNNFDFGTDGESPQIVNLDENIYNNVNGSLVKGFNINNMGGDNYSIDVELVNNKVSSIMNTGMGFVSNQLVAPTTTPKNKFDVFFEDTNANSNKFDNFYYMSQDDDNAFATFERATNAAGGSFVSFHSTPTTLKCFTSASPGGDGTIRAVSSLPDKINVDTAHHVKVKLRCFVDDITTSDGITFQPTNSIGNNGYGAYNGRNHKKNGEDFGGVLQFVQADKGKFVEMEFEGDNSETNHHLGSVIIVLGASELIELSQISISYELNTFVGDLSGEGSNLKGPITYEGYGLSPSNFNLHATRTFFFRPDQSTDLSFDHSARLNKMRGTFAQFINTSNNQNSLGEVNLRFSNRTDKEAYAILHF